MLNTVTLPNSDFKLPGNVDTEILLEMGKTSDFAREAVLKELIRFWHVANNRSQLTPHRSLYGRAIRELGHNVPELANYAEPISREDFEAVTGTEEEG